MFLIASGIDPGASGVLLDGSGDEEARGSNDGTYVLDTNVLAAMKGMLAVITFRLHEVYSGQYFTLTREKQALW